MHLGHGHGSHLIRSFVLVFVMVVGALWTVSHPVQAVTLVWKVVTALTTVADNFATGRYR